ncbi:hypothetical protein Ddye_017793 [Dipteronia dyeriana]|uniref:Transposase MuDR plant domain-containing protein n=1 Tax=Dipteronia dyeriana TaxID=168575 RepID=A0AAD9U9X0_9ROSI|nr:hypothetical protein Ddye_017793 [Dipteronia dyeriana]
MRRRKEKEKEKEKKTMAGAAAVRGEERKRGDGLKMKNVHLVLNWGGEWKSHHCEYWYEGRRAKAFAFSRDSNYDQLLDKVYNVTGIDKDHYRRLVPPPCAFYSINSGEVAPRPITMRLKVGELFPSKRQLQSQICSYAFTNRFQTRVFKSDTTRYQVRCIVEDCNWRLRAAKVHNSDYFHIRKFDNQHTCSTEAQSPHQRQASARVIGEHIHEKFHDHRLCKPKRIIHDMQREFGISCNYHKGYRARHIALEEVQGTPVESYSNLPSYLYMLEQANPGIVTDLHTACVGDGSWVRSGLEDSTLLLRENSTSACKLKMSDVVDSGWISSTTTKSRRRSCSWAVMEVGEGSLCRRRKVGSIGMGGLRNWEFMASRVKLISIVEKGRKTPIAAMVGFRISPVAILKKTVSLLNKLPEPSVIVLATFNFHPEQGMSLLASSDDGRVLGALCIDVGSLDRFICNRPCSFTFDIDHLSTFLNLADDEHSLHMVTSDSENRYLFNIEDSEGKIIQERSMALNYDVIEMHKDFDQTPHEYVVKAGIPTQIFTSTLELFANFEADTISVIVTTKKVKFTNGHHKFVLYKERYGSIIEGVNEDDDGRYVAEFGWRELSSVDDSIRMTSNVWIYPSNGLGSPPVLMCPIDPNPNPIGNIIYYFL